MPLGPSTYRFLGSTTDTTITLTDLAPGTTYRIGIAARALGGYSDTSPTTTVRTAAGRATVSYLNLDWSPTNNQIQHLLKVTNTGTGPLDLSTVRVRYHLRFEGGNTSLVPNCDWAALGCDRIRQTVQFFVPPGGPPGAMTTPAPPGYPIPGTPVPGWVELTFTDGTLAPGQSTGPIQLRHHRHSWSDIDERDDPSWLAATGQWTDERPDHAGRRRGTRVRRHLLLTTPDHSRPRAGRPACLGPGGLVLTSVMPVSHH